MKKRLLLFLLVACLGFSGCAGRQLEDQLLVIVLGVDETPAGDIRVCVKVPSNAGAAGGQSDSGGGGGGGGSGGGSSGGGASSGGEQAGYLMLEATGKKFADAVNLLHATTPRTLNFSQAREVVIGENAAKSTRFSQLIHSIYILPRMRAQAKVVVCKKEARDFVNQQKPYVGMRLSRYVETTLSNYAGKGFVPTTTLGEGLRDLGYGFRDPLLLYAAVNSFENTDTANADNALEGETGSLPRKSAVPIDFFGAAATDGVSVSGVLTGYEMALVHLLQGDVNSLCVEAKGENATPIYALAPAALEVDLSARPAVLRIRLACRAEYPAGFMPDTEALRDRLETDLSDMVAHLQALRCDGLGFGNIAVRQFSTVQGWEALGWRDVYADAKIELTITLQMQKI